MTKKRFCCTACAARHTARRMIFNAGDSMIICDVLEVDSVILANWLDKQLVNDDLNISLHFDFDTRRISLQMFYQHRRLRVKDTLLDTKMTMTHADKLSSLEVIMASMPVTLDRRIEGYKKRSKKSPSCTRDTKFMKALSDGTTQGVTVTAEHVRRATSIYGPTLESIKVRITWTKGIPMPVTDYHRVTDTQTMKIDSPTVPHNKCAASRPHYDIFTARRICNSYKKSFSTTHRAL